MASRGGAGKAGATLTAGEVADRHPGFRPIADALRRPPAGGAAVAVHVPIRVEMPADPLNGQPSLALVFPVPETDWKLVQVSPRSELEQAAVRISRSLLLLISGILLAVLLPSYLFLSRRWITPVTTLAEAATLVRDGELDVRVSMPGRDEIAVLADAFNQMVDQLAANTAGLKQANVELGRSLGLTDTIMGTVREGLFLLTPELAIEAKYSAATRQIFGQEELAGADFLDLIQRITPKRTHELTARFLRLLLNPAKTDSVIAKINPLKEIEASFPGRSGQLEQKFLTFTFERIREGGEIRHAMVTVADVTPRVLLAQQLKQSQQRMERQSELLLSVMHVEPQVLREFIEDAHSELETINALLREGRSALLSIPIATPSTATWRTTSSRASTPSRARRRCCASAISPPPPTASRRSSPRSRAGPSWTAATSSRSCSSCRRWSTAWARSATCWPASPRPSAASRQPPAPATPRGSRRW